MILLINICKEKLHYLEFVKPIEDILNINKIKYSVKTYKEVSKKDLQTAEKIIICGTSLKDNDFVNNINYFNWLGDFEKPVLGICGGMQIIGLIFGGKLEKKTEIGFYFEYFDHNCLGLIGRQEVYHLHNYFINFTKLPLFERYTSNKDISQAVKHREKNIYGVLFHPEVRQKALIKNFCLL
jgi:anthranilate/para-aminobenzoate synthase component II